MGELRGRFSAVSVFFDTTTAQANDKPRSRGTIRRCSSRNGVNPINSPSDKDQSIQETPDIGALRDRWYNATLVRRFELHDDLLRFRVAFDEGQFDFASGQYTVLGLGAWEERVDRIPPSWPGLHPSKHPLVRRAYSMSCPVLDEQEELRPCSQWDTLEFYVTLIDRPTDQPPMLTPRLFALKEGDRLFVGPHAHGRYTLEPVGEDDDVIFVATGTGEAPHCAMIAELLARGHRGLIVSLVCTRHGRDQGYLPVFRKVEQKYPNFRYFPLTTREPRNLDSTRADFVGKQYVQEFFDSGDLEKQLGRTIEPERTHVFLCGNPAMIGIPQGMHDGHPVFPEPPGMIETLMHRGFRPDAPRQPGNVHFEKYW